MDKKYLIKKINEKLLEIKEVIESDEPLPEDIEKDFAFYVFIDDSLGEITDTWNY